GRGLRGGGGDVRTAGLAEPLTVEALHRAAVDVGVAGRDGLVHQVDEVGDGVLGGGGEVHLDGRQVALDLRLPGGGDGGPAVTGLGGQDAVEHVGEGGRRVDAAVGRALH